MPVLSAGQVYGLAVAAGLSASSAVTATAIARAESSWNSDSLGDVGLENNTWGPSVGLWQIRSIKAQTGTGGSRDASRLTDPTFNAHAMASISNGGTNWMPWSTFTSGAYKKYLPAVQDAVRTGGAPVPNTGGSGGAQNTLDLNPGDWVSNLVSGLKDDLLSSVVYLTAIATAGGLIIAGALKMADTSSTPAAPAKAGLAEDAAVLA